MAENWAKSVEAAIVNTEVSIEGKTQCHRNAYLVKLLGEYNLGTSVQHPTGMKMYAELMRKESIRS